MNQQPDKFFREKLEGYQKPAPASAWGKIAATQHKKKRRGVWLQVAASMLPLAVACYVLWPIENTSHTNSLSTTNKKDSTANTNVPDQKLRDNKTAAIEEKTPAANTATTKDFTKADTKQRGTSKATIRKAEPNSTGHDVHNGVANVSSVVVPTEQVAGIQAAQEVLPIVESNSVAVQQERKTVTLQFSAKDVSQYLEKKSEGEATADTKKPSTLQKLLKKANDLGTQDPFGELRQKKNEILALNFKSDKQRGQNK